MTKTPLATLLNPEHLIALDKLACLLAQLPDDYKQFTMHIFASHLNERGLCEEEIAPREVASKFECGTVACALGHLPLLGYDPFHLTPHRQPMGWNSFGERHTGLRNLSVSDLHADLPIHNPIAEISSLWRWCFASEWIRHRPTAKDAAMRIAFMLDYYDTNNNRLDDPHYNPASVAWALKGMDDLGEETLLGARKQVRLELTSPYLMERLYA